MADKTIATMNDAEFDALAVASSSAAKIQ